MKAIIYNHNNLKEEEIDETVIRTKALIINSNDEIMLGFCDNTYQFPGGHLKEGETLLECLRREVREETGIDLEELNLKPFAKITYYSRNYRDTAKNRKNEIYYFIIKTNAKVNKNNIELDEFEKKGNYTIKLISLNKVEEVLVGNIDSKPINKTIVEEMLTILNEYKNVEVKVK